MRSVTIYNFLIEATITGSLLMLLLLLARVFLHKGVGSSMLYAAWLLVALRLLLPLSLPNPLMNALRPVISSNFAARPLADHIRMSALDVVYDASRTLAGEDLMELNQNPLFQLGTALANGQLGALLLVIYCGGGVVAMASMLLRHRSFRRSIQGKTRLSPEENQEYAALCMEMGIRAVPVYWTDTLTDSCLVGLVHPTILLPKGLHPEERRLALRHELTHLRMHEPWWGFLRNVCCAIHWLNPLAWLGAWISKEDSERACDAQVAAALSPEALELYTQMLATATSKGTVPPLGVLSTEVSANTKRMKRRVTQVQQGGTPRRWLRRVFVLTALFASLCAFCTGEIQHSTTLNAYDAIISSMPAPGVRVQRRILDTPRDAANWFRRLLDSPYVHTVPPGEIIAERTDETWTVTSGEISAVFDIEGVITYFANPTPLAEAMQIPENSLVDKTDESLLQFVRQFTEECLPDVTVRNMTIVRDRLNSEGRFLSCVGGHPHSQEAYSLILQVEPEVRVISFSLLDTEDRALVRISSLEGAENPPDNVVADLPTQRITMAQAREIAIDRVNRQGNGGAEDMSSISVKLLEEEEPPVWLAAFSNEGVLVYEVRIDATNGEVLDMVDVRDPELELMVYVGNTPAPGEISKAEAIALARKEIASRYGFSLEEVATFLVADTRYQLPGAMWYSYQAEVNSWYISFRMPETDPAFLCDYEVMLDAATGEILHVFDPANSGNG